MLEEIIKEEVKEFLSALGYEYEKTDSILLTYAIHQVKHGICAFCNILELPVDLKEVVLSRAVGEFLLLKQSTGQLKEMNFNESVVKSIQIGDTTTTFAVDEKNGSKIDMYIQYLRSYGEEEILAHRRIIW